MGSPLCNQVPCCDDSIQIRGALGLWSELASCSQPGPKGETRGVSCWVRGRDTLPSNLPSAAPMQHGGSRGTTHYGRRPSCGLLCCLRSPIAQGRRDTGGRGNESHTPRNHTRKRKQLGRTKESLRMAGGGSTGLPYFHEMLVHLLFPKILKAICRTPSVFHECACMSLCARARVCVCVRAQVRACVCICGGWGGLPTVAGTPFGTRFLDCGTRTRIDRECWVLATVSWRLVDARCPQHRTGRHAVLHYLGHYGPTIMYNDCQRVTVEETAWADGECAYQEHARPCAVAQRPCLNRTEPQPQTQLPTVQTPWTKELTICPHRVPGGGDEERATFGMAKCGTIKVCQTLPWHFKDRNRRVGLRAGLQ